jgi:hypothetical protein
MEADKKSADQEGGRDDFDVAGRGDGARNNGPNDERHMPATHGLDLPREEDDQTLLVLHGPAHLARPECVDEGAGARSATDPTTPPERRNPGRCGGLRRWARRVSNVRPLACEARSME